MRCTPFLNEKEGKFKELIERVRQWSSSEVSDAEIRKAAADILKLYDNDWLVFEGANLEILISVLDLQAAQVAAESNAAQPPQRSLPGQRSEGQDHGHSTGPPDRSGLSSTEHFSSVKVAQEEAAEPASKQPGKGATHLKASQYLGTSEDDEEADTPLLRRPKLHGNPLLGNQTDPVKWVNQRQALQPTETGSRALQGKQGLDSFPAAPPHGLNAYLLASGTAGGSQGNGVINLDQESNKTSSRVDLSRARHPVPLLKRKKRDNCKLLSDQYSHDTGAVAQPRSQPPGFGVPDGTAVLKLSAAGNKQPVDDDIQDLTVWVEVPEDQGMDVGTAKLPRFACSADGCSQEFPDVGALRKHAHVHEQKQHTSLPPLNNHAGPTKVADQKPDFEPAPASNDRENESPKRSLQSGPGRPGVRKCRRKKGEAVGVERKRRPKLPIRRAKFTEEGGVNKGASCAGHGVNGSNLKNHLGGSCSEKEVEKEVQCKSAKEGGSQKGTKTDIEGPGQSLKTCQGLPGGATGPQAPSSTLESPIFCKQGGIVVSRDISDGRERLPISCVNEVNGQTDLTEVKDFCYHTTSRIASTNGAKSTAVCSVVDFSLDRLESPCECNGDCLSQVVPCVCASTTRGKYAYDKNGCLIEDYQVDYAHSPAESKDFIRECSDKCSCGYGACGNRVVQRGITVPLQVFMTKRKGWGVRPLTNVPAGHFLYEYIGEICTNKDCMQRERKYAAATSHIFTMSLDADYDMEELHFNGGLNDNEALTLDATKRGNVSRFMNHSCDNCNVLFRPVQVDIHDTHYYRVAFFTSRKVKALEELTWDYGCQFDGGAQSIAEFSCCCESQNCRDSKKLTR